MRISQWTHFLSLPVLLRVACAEAGSPNNPEPPIYESNLGGNQQSLLGLCPDYTNYARRRHKPFSEGPLELPYQRPHPECRKFSSPAAEKVIDDLFPHFKDPDLAQIFRNAFPNTLDTTVLWHVDGVNSQAPPSRMLTRDKNIWKQDRAYSFIVTGDINAEWLRDSTNQLQQYQGLARSAPDIKALLLGAINTQAEFVIASPYCNAFQPPDSSRLPPVQTDQDDYVHPAYEPSIVFECKYELDSLANFLSLGNQYHAATGAFDFLTARWYKALDSVLRVLEAQSTPTFDRETGRFEPNEYSFSRTTRQGTETLNLGGNGNPLAGRTGLVRSAFRPSDDATTFGFLIPSNAMMAVELARTADVLDKVAKAESTPESDTKFIVQVAADLRRRSETIKEGIYNYAIVKHPEFGDVFAYEVDGYGSHLLIDDANVPSLLSLPLLGFVSANDRVYQNTRRMILTQRGNPYYLSGPKFHGIGGPHIGLRNAWPMSVLVQAMTSEDDEEILDCLARVKNISVFGLINESVDVHRGVGSTGDGMTRSWFAWANSVFAKTVLWLAEEKPELVLKRKGKYIVGNGWTELDAASHN